MKDFGIIVVTFIRDDVLFNCIESIRKFYRDVNIYVIDQGRSTYKKSKFLKDHRVNYLRLPYDSGLALSRNLGMLVSKEKYMVISDDDFVFTENTRLENWKRILDQRPWIGVAAGMVITRGQEWHYEHELRKFKTFYVMKDMKNIRWHNCDGIKYHYCDLTLNFFMLRRECWKDCPWDSEYKIVHEHLQYFLDMKDQGKWRVAYTPTVTAIHDKEPHCDEYEAHRTSRARKRISWLHYYQKTGVRFGIYVTKAEGGLKVIDLKTGELVSDHHLFINKISGDRQGSVVQGIYKKISEEIDAILEEAQPKPKEKELSEEELKLKALKNDFWRKRRERVQEAR